MRRLRNLKQVASEAELSRILGKPDVITGASPVERGGYWHEYRGLDAYQFQLKDRFPFIDIIKKTSPEIRVHIFGRDKESDLARLNRLLSVNDIYAQGVIVEEYEVTPTHQNYQNKTKPVLSAGAKDIDRYRASREPTVSLLTAPVDFSSQLVPITPENVFQIEKLAQIEHVAAYDIVWKPDGKQFALVVWKRPVQIWDASRLKWVHTIGRDKKIINFAFSCNPDVVAFSEDDILVECMNLSIGKSWIVDSRNAQPALQFSPDGKLLATGGYGSSVKLWNTECGELVSQWESEGEKGGLRVAFARNGQHMAVSNHNSTIRLYDFATNKLLHVLDRPNVYELAFCPNSKMLAASYADGGVGIWDVASGELLHITTPKKYERYTFSWSSNGEIIAARGDLTGITLLCSQDFSVLRQLPEIRQGGSCCIRFNPSGTMVLAASGNHVDVWGCKGNL